MRSGKGNKMIMGIEVQLQRVGKIPAPKTLFTTEHVSSERFDESFPAFMTAGDISKDGTQILLRGKHGNNISYL